jgi:hypothetical protein
MLEYFAYAVCFALGKEVVEALIYCLGADGNADLIKGTIWWILHYKQARKRAIWYGILWLVFDRAVSKPTEQIRVQLSRRQRVHRKKLTWSGRSAWFEDDEGASFGSEPLIRSEAASTRAAKGAESKNAPGPNHILAAVQIPFFFGCNLQALG